MTRKAPTPQQAAQPDAPRSARPDANVQTRIDPPHTASDSVDDWGYKPTRSGIAGEVKLALMLILTLVSAFGFVAYRKLNDIRKHVAAGETAPAASFEELDLDTPPTSPDSTSNAPQQSPATGNGSLLEPTLDEAYIDTPVHSGPPRQVERFGQLNLDGPPELTGDDVRHKDRSFAGTSPRETAIQPTRMVETEPASIKPPSAKPSSINGLLTLTPVPAETPALASTRTPEPGIESLPDFGSDPQSEPAGLFGGQHEPAIEPRPANSNTAASISPVAPTPAASTSTVDRPVNLFELSPESTTTLADATPRTASRGNSLFPEFESEPTTLPSSNDSQPPVQPELEPTPVDPGEDLFGPRPVTPTPSPASIEFPTFDSVETAGPSAPVEPSTPPVAESEPLEFFAPRSPRELPVTATPLTISPEPEPQSVPDLSRSIPPRPSLTPTPRPSDAVSPTSTDQLDSPGFNRNDSPNFSEPREPARINERQPSLFEEVPTRTGPASRPAETAELQPRPIPIDDRQSLWNDPAVSQPNPTTSRTPSPQVDDFAPPVGQDRVHDVQPGDNYWKISRTHYGTIRYFGALSEYNRDRIASPEKMRPGMKVLIPDPSVLESRYPQMFRGMEPAGTPEAPKTDGIPGFYVSADGEPMYRVGKGDTLTSIAQKHLGRSSRWVQIHGLNEAILTTPDSLKLGMELRLPRDASQVEVTPEGAVSR